MNPAADQEKSEEKYIGIEEAAQLLETHEAEVEALINQGTLHAYRIGDRYLRLRKEQVSELKARWRIQRELFSGEPLESRLLLSRERSSLWERLFDFWYFNDFYILSVLVMASLIVFIISSQ